jgi:hypothetical protein
MELIGNSSHVLIKILKYSNPHSADEWDRKWLNIKVMISLNGFQSNYKTQFLIDDFLAFSNMLKKVIEEKEGEVEFKTLEEAFYMKGTVNYIGKVEWEGFALYPIGEGNKLSFKFESDFSQLDKIKNELENDLISIS